MRTTATSLDCPDYDRPFIDYDFHRNAPAWMREEATNETRSRRAARNLGLAVLVATGAFWTVMLNDPPKSKAPDLSISAKSFTALDPSVALDRPTADHVEH